MVDDQLELIAAWMRRYQSTELDAERVADPSRSSEGLSQLVQNVIEALPFEAEPTAFALRLHELALKDLGDD
ncbi:MAG: hypothetical protein VX990_07125 [Pseudomonadota bacterium]|nr:hypothetical protein [Pseudomonadota bacterium]